MNVRCGALYGLKSAELANLVKAEGFELGTRIPDWSAETARALEESFVNLQPY
jgi:hypothetical protein